MVQTLSDAFIGDLIQGRQKDLLEYVKNNSKFDMQIRPNSVLVYYRGVPVLEVIESALHTYEFVFDHGHLNPQDFYGKDYSNPEKHKWLWNEFFPMIEATYDHYQELEILDEQDFQQNVVRVNNYSSNATQTDFFIIKSDYYPYDRADFDMVAVRLQPNRSIEESQKHQPLLYVIEVRFGEDDFDMRRGVERHIHVSNYIQLVNYQQALSEFMRSMIETFKCQCQLGLIPSMKGLEGTISDSQFGDQLGLLFLLINQNSRSKLLIDSEVHLVKNDVRFIKMRNKNYELYSDQAFGFDQFTKLFKRHKISPQLPFEF
mgnify:FL=1